MVPLQYKLNFYLLSYNITIATAKVIYQTCCYAGMPCASLHAPFRKLIPFWRRKVSNNDS